MIMTATTAHTTHRNSIYLFSIRWRYCCCCCCLPLCASFRSFVGYISPVLKLLLLFICNPLSWMLFDSHFIYMFFFFRFALIYLYHSELWQPFWLNVMALFWQIDFTLCLISRRSAFFFLSMLLSFYLSLPHFMSFIMGLWWLLFLSLFVCCY